jgi:uncharacterized protein
MIALDTNILVYAHKEQSPFHKEAKAALQGLCRGTDRWAIAWPCVYEFINIVTHPKIYQPASTLAEAFTAIESWGGGGNLDFLHEGRSFLPTLKTIALEAQVRGPKIHDARIAAICLRHGVREVWTADRDFSAFTSLRTRNPLMS